MQIMRSATVITLALFAARTHAEEVDKLVERANQDPRLDIAELDDTTLGKSGASLMSMASPTNLIAMPRTVPAAHTNVRPFVAPSFRQASSGFAPVRSPTLDTQRTVQTHAAPAGADAKSVKVLRDATGAGMMDCKKALVECNGDLEEATAFLRKKGLASAEKRAGRSTGEGIVEAYIHGGAKLGVLVEVNCETDFVAKNPDFKEFARNIAMQIAASPTVDIVDEEGVSPEWLAKEKEIMVGSDDMKGKPEQVVEKIVTGKIAKLIKTRSLVAQPYIKNPDETVEQYIKSTIAKFGENIRVARFSKFKMEKR